MYLPPYSLRRTRGGGNRVWPSFLEEAQACPDAGDLAGWGQFAGERTVAFGALDAECMEILSIATDKQIKLYAVKGNWQLDGSIQSKIIAMAFSMAAEIERDLLSQRTKEALAARKRAGVKLGRPRGIGKSKLDEHRPEIEALLKNGSTQKFIAQRYQTTEANLSRWLAKHQLKKRRGTNRKQEDGL